MKRFLTILCRLTVHGSTIRGRLDSRADNHFFEIFILVLNGVLFLYFESNFVILWFSCSRFCSAVIEFFACCFEADIPGGRVRAPDCFHKRMK